MAAKIKIAFWVLAIGISFILLVLSGLAGKGIGDTAEILVWLGMVGMVASFYSAIFLMCTGAERLLTHHKFRRMQEPIKAVIAKLGAVVELGGSLALVALGLYLGYLFVSWAGFIGTLLVLIAGLLFLIVILLLDR